MSIINDFEDGDLNEFSGTKGEFSTTKSPVFNGNYSLYCSPSNNNDHMYVEDELFVRDGRTYTLYFRPTSGNSGNGDFTFGGSQSTKNCYVVETRTFSSEFMLAVNGVTISDGNELDSASVNWNANDWYRIEITYGSTLTVDLYNDTTSTFVVSLSTTNSARGDGGYGFTANGNVDHYWDYVSDDGFFSPSNLSATGSSRQIDLSWTDNSGSEDGFYIYRSTSSGSSVGDYTQIDSVGSNITTYSDTGLDDGERYYYRVSAFSSNSESELSNEDATTTPLPAPTNVVLNTGVAGEIDTSWTDNANNEDDYEIYRGTSSGSLSSLKLLSANTTSYLDTSVSDGRTYYYRVDVSTEHLSSTSSEVSATSVLPAPSGLLATAVSPSQIDLTWTDNTSDNDGYRVYYKQSANSSFTQFSDITPSATSEFVTGLTSGTQYDFYVEAYTSDATATSATVSSTTGKDLQRSTTVEGDGAIEATRTTTKSRTVSQSLTVSSSVTATLTEVFPSEQALDVSWDYDQSRNAFVTEWLAEASIIPDTERDGLGVDFNGILVNTVDVWVLYDRDGDGVPEYTSTKHPVDRIEQTVTFDDGDLLGADGYYAVVVQGMRKGDTINQVDIGPVHENL